MKSAFDKFWLIQTMGFPGSSDAIGCDGIVFATSECASSSRLIHGENSQAHLLAQVDIWMPGAFSEKAIEKKIARARNGSNRLSGFSPRSLSDSACRLFERPQRCLASGVLARWERRLCMRAAFL